MRRALGVAGVAVLVAAAGAAACKRAPTGGPPDREAGIRACVLLEGCGFDPVTSFASGLICGDTHLGEAYGLRGVVESIRDCVLDAAGAGGGVCPEVAACLNGGDAPGACTGTDTSCAGDVVVGCATGTETAFDCAPAGLTCVADATGGAECGLGPCDPATTADACDGTVVERCNAGGVLAPSDCALQSLTCVAGAAAVSCAGTGEACDPLLYAASCQGDVAVSCVGGQVARLDCAGFVEGWTCRVLGASAVDCAPAAMDCTDISDDACDGAEIVLCVDGRFWRYDCVALGFSGCTVVDNLPYCV